MTTLPRVIEMVREWVPDLEGRISQFEIEPFDLDDELVDAFREELERLSGDLQAGLDELDNEKARLAVHSIKGMSGTMGLPEISVLAQEIEITLRADDLERARQLSDVLIAWARNFIADSE